ncbi:type II toxin-antitoxin system VapC family toxin [Bradyrhizobium sp.]|uniref:type II toxin-antitoxin system VapC family toxin n=1 Tax=Bradyrhizobium sp. TaxID=376 RepID=UPI001DBED935|nr:type II toxin-antitoxin system VapC family toxin [Bradyrhizobium sp.]MBV8701515.1 type II toxin-antitoxin system VapC family toxin [Bradyrhizobium sp.]MBV8917753.1 type II toxin-antitoxin system VapC family toxin [Bradyrhizobium sp.]MBV9980142.1 type II toxin-antitoxin system VapC family toxin [Bradyrhizobium sp.]
MVIDTSAIVAIALNEPDAADLERRIADDPVRLISAATVLEVTIVLETRLGDAGGREFDLWLLKIGAEIVPVDAEQTDAARRAWRRFGKGRHGAALNYGDCFAYALAVTRGEPLLFKGEDFAKTDVNQSGGT